MATRPRIGEERGTLTPVAPYENIIDLIYDRSYLRPVAMANLIWKNRYQYPDTAVHQILAVPAAALTNATAILVGTGNNGILRASSLVVSNLSAAASSLTTVQLLHMNGGTILFSDEVNVLATAFAGIFWTFSNLRLPF